MDSWLGINIEKTVPRYNNHYKENLMNWIKGRIKEMSSWSGASLIALGMLIILGGPFVNILAYAAVVWGALSIIKKD